MKYLRKFATKADMADLVQPNVVLIEDTEKVLYNAKIYAPGVYIQHINGDLYTTADWSAKDFTNDEANGVAVVSAKCNFIIAKTDVSQPSLCWGGYGKTLEDIVTATSNSSALLDYDGEGNTSKIIQQLNGYDDGTSLGAPAAEYCKAYIFPNGKKGYLPSIGEWKTAYNNRTAIDSAISLIGGAAINTNSYYSSSTQCDSAYNWGIYWSGGYLNQNTKKSTYYVRAFTTLE